MKNNWYKKSLVSVDPLKLEDIELLFDKTKEMEKLVKQKGGDDRLKGKIMAALFFEPSTRTFSSFITAIQRLGGGIIPLNGMQNTSVAKGESFHHTVQVFSRYADCLVIRHPEVGMPKLACGYASMPIINAGDGIGEHPTQALFDTYTIREHFGSLNNLVLTMVGDLKFGRTVHSLTKLLAKLDQSVRFNFVSPKLLAMPQEIIKAVETQGTSYSETEKLDKVIGETDVLYVTRVQKERFTDLGEYERLKSFYMVNKKMLEGVKSKMIVMHPLPIATGEINNDLDDDSRSVYLTEQLSNGLYLRMALLDLILKEQ